MDLDAFADFMESEALLEAEEEDSPPLPLPLPLDFMDIMVTE